MPLGDPESKNDHVLAAPRLYQHRINTIERLSAVPSNHGIELDLRSSGDDVLVTHDPFTSGPRIEEFFPHIGARPCIFNVKTEGIEERVRALASQHEIGDYFLLDCSVPAAVKLARAGEDRFAVRYSEMEPEAGLEPWIGKARWIWVDCFTEYPGTAATWERLARHFRLCLVSPELQGHDDDTAERLRASLLDRPFHAVCTKLPARWGAE